MQGQSLVSSNDLAYDLGWVSAVQECRIEFETGRAGHHVRFTVSALNETAAGNRIRIVLNSWFADYLAFGQCMGSGSDGHIHHVDQDLRQGIAWVVMVLVAVFKVGAALGNRELAKVFSGDAAVSNEALPDLDI